MNQTDYLIGKAIEQERARIVAELDRYDQTVYLGAEWDQGYHFGLRDARTAVLGGPEESPAPMPPQYAITHRCCSCPLECDPVLDAPPASPAEIQRMHTEYHRRKR